MCGNDSIRKDYDQFESDCDGDSLPSMASTCCESQANNINQTEEEDRPADADNWENLKEDDRSDKIEDALKHLGNVRKKKMSPNILKDLLGDDGNHAIKGIKTNHDNLIHREKRKLSEIYKAVSYFETKMSKRRSTLREKTASSNNNTYIRRKCYWRDAWKEINSGSGSTRVTTDALRTHIFSDDFHL